MAYTHGYEYDIFISYSHDDDTEPDGRKGWAAAFRDYLESWLTKKRGLEGLKIWFATSELNGNTLFDQAIKDRISSSALFFVLHSHNYQKSAYCKKELDWFCQRNEQRPEGLAIGDHSRLFNILINNLPHTEWPKALSRAGGRTGGFILHDAENGHGFGYPTDPDESRFTRQIRKLVDATVDTLDAFPRQPCAEAATQSERRLPDITVFLADVPDTLRPFRERLIAEIGDQARILDALPPPYPVTEHNRELERQFDQASLTIHLLDQWPGRTVDDLPEQTYPRLQAEIAARHTTPSMLWIPDSLSVTAFEDKAQAAWLKQMEQGERGETHFQFIRSDRQALIDQVIQTITRLRRQSSDADSIRFLIDTHQKDQRAAFELATLLAKREADVEINKDSRDPAKSLSDFEQAVRQTRNLIILFGNVAPIWLKERMQTTVKVVAEQFQHDRPTLEKLWIVLLPGCPGRQAVPPLPSLLQVGLLDNTHATEIAPTLLDELLGAGRQEARSKTVEHPPAPRHPFVGLRPYEREESLWFFGRNEQTKSLLGLLHEHHFVAVVGSSGSGKSSLVRAGLIPQLEAGFLVQERDRWVIATMQPGDSPLCNLVQSLTHAPDASPDGKNEARLLEQVREHGVQALLDSLASRRIDTDTNILLVVDQFEELFRFSLEQKNHQRLEQAKEFVALLLSLGEQRQLPVFICLTMRSDFLGDCDAFHGLPEAISRSQFLVPRLTRDQRREVITSPIAMAGGEIASRLVDRLLNENIDTRNDLPLLQHLLMRVWEAWRADPGHPPRIDLRHYEQVHTIHHALNDHADEALAELDDQQQAIAKTLFQALTTTDTANRRIRRPVHLEEICTLTGATRSRVNAVIEVFIDNNRSFLLRSSGENPDNPLIDISHESLIRHWKQLGEWVDEEARAAKTYRRLVETAELHTAEAPRYYREADLAQVLEWRQRHDAHWAARYNGDFAKADDFLKQSQRIAEQEQKQKERHRREREQLLRENARIAEQKAEQQQAALKKTRRLLGLTGLLATFMILATGIALRAWNHARNETARAEQQAQLAKSETAKAEKQTLLAHLYTARAFEEKSLHALEKAEKTHDMYAYQDAWLYALEAARQQVPQNQLALRPEAMNAFMGTGALQAFQNAWFSPTLDIDGGIYAVAYSPNGRSFLSGSGDGTLHLWDATTGKLLRTLERPTGPVNAVAYSPDGKTLLSGSGDGTLRLWDATTGKLLRTLEGHTDSVRAVAFSPDGKTLLSGSDDSTLRLWDATTGKPLRTLKGHTWMITSVAFSPDGKTLLSGSYDSTLRLWDAVTGKPLRTLEGHIGPVNAVAYSPDGKTLLSGSYGGTLRLWDTTTGKLLQILEGHAHRLNAMALSPDGKTLLIGSTYSRHSLLYGKPTNRTLSLQDTASGKLLWAVEGNATSVTAVAFSPDGKTLLCGSRDGTLRLRDAATGKLLRMLKGHTGSVTAVAFSPDRNTLLSGSNDLTLRLWDATTGKLLQALEGHTEGVTSVAYSPDGKTLLSGADDNTLRLWDAGTGKLLRMLKSTGYPWRITAVAYSPDGKTLLSGSSDRTLRLWDATTGKLLRTLEGHTYSVTAVAFSPDGKTLLSGSDDRTLRLWDATTGKPLRTLEGHTGPVNAVAYSPDGKTLLSGSADRTLRLWDAVTGKLLRTVEGHTGSVLAVAYSPDGKTLLSGSNDR
ncbi:MAG TPA: TIR domain-containing protein, partial [Gammaproteobacteria bacterium]|nr:TIR domain-containing protein [Gammaproteobacteria bacterium]